MLTSTLPGFEFDDTGFKPFPPSDVLRGLVPLVRSTMWPERGASGRLSDENDLWMGLCYWHVVRGVSLLTLLSTAVDPGGHVLDDLKAVPMIKSGGDGEPDTQYVAIEHQATRLRDQVASDCPPSVKKLLHGRIETALRQWPTTQADVFATLAGTSAPLPAPDLVENDGNRRYGARLASALFSTFLGVPELRWPLATAWATSELLWSWVDWADNVPPQARKNTLGVAPYGSSDPKRYEAPLPGWADLVV